jgi:hypothetical protein
MEDESLEVNSLNCGVCCGEFPTNQLHSINVPKINMGEILICAKCLDSLAESLFKNSVNIIDIVKISTQINQTDSERITKIIALMVQSDDNG